MRLLYVAVVVATGVLAVPASERSLEERSPVKDGFRLVSSLGDSRGSFRKRGIDASVGLGDRIWVSVGIGTPSQDLDFLPDSGADDFSVQSTVATQNGFDAGDQPKYDPSKSSSAKVVPGHTWSIAYGNGIPYYSGQVYQETINLGGNTYFDIPILVVTNGSGASYGDRAGNLGLDANTLAPTTPRDIPSFTQAIKSQLKSQKSLVAYHFDLFLREGGVDFGFVDSTLYTGTLQYHSIVGGASQTEWRLQYDGIVVNGRLVSYPFQTIHDFGGGFGGNLPKQLLDAYFAQIKGATYSGSTYNFACDANLPNMVFSIDGQQLSVPKQTWVNGPLGQAGRQCSCAFSSSGDNTGFFGMAYLLGVYIVFDQDGRRVGLANRPAISVNFPPSPFGGIAQYCSQTNFQGACTTETFNSSECVPITSKPQYHNVQSFQSLANGGSYCALYSDTACANPIVGSRGIRGKTTNTQSFASSVAAYACWSVTDYPTRTGSGVLQQCTGPDDSGKCVSTSWNRFECHSIDSSVVGSAQSFDQTSGEGYCYFYRNTGCTSQIGQALPYVNGAPVTFPFGPYAKSFLCI